MASLFLAAGFLGLWCPFMLQCFAPGNLVWLLFSLLGSSSEVIIRLAAKNRTHTQKSPTNILTPVFAVTCSLMLVKSKFWSWILRKGERKKNVSAPQKVITLLVIYVFCFVGCDRNVVLESKIKCIILVFEIYVPSWNFSLLQVAVILVNHFSFFHPWKIFVSHYCIIFIGQQWS